jgi:hypothetical protein
VGRRLEVEAAQGAATGARVVQLHEGRQPQVGREIGTPALDEEAARVAVGPQRDAQHVGQVGEGVRDHRRQPTGRGRRGGAGAPMPPPCASQDGRVGGGPRRRRRRARIGRSRAKRDGQARRNA